MAGSITVTPIPDGPRRRQQASTQLLHEYISMMFAGSWTRYEMRLGPTVKTAPGLTLTPQIEAMLRRSNRYADAIVVTPVAIYIIEAKMVAVAGALAQLEEYYALAPLSPELKPFLPRTIRMMLLVAVDDNYVHTAAELKGIEVVIFSPQWAADYVADKYMRPNRWRKKQGSNGNPDENADTSG